ncbi:MAG TPA: sigma-70 family RNA polymerase sigma factor [Tahibacter sp.]|uniref:RNA polymerase sigma factor n=1 Tax=Tahibacter sp. TaxID=2056211 RepID=UPI002B6B689F|nr:sigma-70 family RNA polymerase sigma factor [Tahibacter sp.]HSX62615.1 sigma-70 family RNA polymerase sigma factor [Tahibacter sp.]
MPASSLARVLPFGHRDVERPAPAAASEATEVLIRRVRSGEGIARDALMRRFLPLLRQWAHGRLPRAARDLHETEDLVQLALMRALRQIDHFECEGPGSFLAYLRQILLNQVRDEVRRLMRRPESAEIDSEMADTDLPSPVEQLVGHERLRAYEGALASLPKRQQGLIVMRLEFGMSYPEIATEVGSTPDAVRVMVARALVQLATALKPHQSDEN